MLAIVAALAEELAPLRKRLDGSVTASEAGLSVCHGELCGQPLLLVRTGIGPARAQEAVAALVERYDLEAILSIGFAGAVVAGLGPGDLLIASQVYALPEEPGEASPAASDGLACDPALVDLAVAAARQRGLPFQVGSSLTVPQVVDDPRLKERLAHRSLAAVVEMESYWIVRVAARQRIPFLTVRAVSDALGDRLPDLRGVFDETGNVHALRALGRLARRPQQLPAVLRLAAGARLAARNLAIFVEGFLPLLPAAQGGPP